MSDTDVGGIIAYLRLDPSDWKKEAAEADAAIEKLEGRDPHVKINVDGAAAAITQIQAVARAEGQLQDANERVRRAEIDLANVRKTSDATSEKVIRAEYDLGKARRDASAAELNLGLVTQRSADQLKKFNDEQDKSTAKTKEQTQGFNALIPAIVAVAPAMVPIAAGATGLALAFGGMGLAGLVAFKGVEQAMADATPVGRAFSAGLDTLSADFGRLEASAAPRVLASFQQGVMLLNGSMPQLNSLTGELASVTGQVGVNLLTGVVDGLLQMRPLIEDGAVSILHLSNEFSSLMSSGGVTAFGDYARSVLPQVVTTVEDLATTAGHLVVALAPLGGASLTAIEGISQAINAIPMPVLTTLATVAPAAFLGFKTASAVTAGVAALSTALEGLGAAGEAAAGGVRSLEAAAGPIGLAVAGASIALAYFSDQSRQAQQTVDNLTDAFKLSHGAIDQHIKDMQYTALQQDGAIESAKRLGISLSDLTQASLGNADAYARVQTAITGLQYQANHLQWGSDKANQMNTDLTNVRGGIDATTKSLADGRQGYIDWNAAMNGANGTTVQASMATQLLAGSIGVSSNAVEGAVAAAKAHADATANATLQMIAENDAAGLLKQGLDALNGKVLNVEQAQTRTAQATLNATDTIRKNKSALDLNTAAGTANRAAIEQAATSAQNEAVAIATQTGSRDKANASILRERDNMLASLKAQGLLTPAIKAYILELYKIPDSRKTQLEIQNDQALAAVAATRAAIASLQNRTITVTTNTVRIDSGAYAGKQVSANAEGSIIGGAGVRAMAAGDLLGASREASISSRPILWGEAGPEAYIPLSPGPKRPRAERLLAAANEAMGNPLGAGSLAGIRISGTLESPWGPVQVQGQIDQAFDRQGRELQIGTYD